MATKDRLISADALIRDINADLYRTESEKAYDRCLVHRQPTVNAVVHGQWVHDGEDTFHCSVCGYADAFPHMDDGIRPHKYCPDCGAKMDGGADNGL